LRPIIYSIFLLIVGGMILCKRDAGRCYRKTSTLFSSFLSLSFSLVLSLSSFLSICISGETILSTGPVTQDNLCRLLSTINMTLLRLKVLSSSYKKEYAKLQEQTKQESKQAPLGHLGICTIFFFSLHGLHFLPPGFFSVLLCVGIRRPIADTALVLAEHATSG
jgi:hypothetical protein